MSFGKRVKTGLAAALLLAGTITNAPAFDRLEDTPSGEAMAFDLLLIRPVGLAATVVGTALFVVTLPFDLIQWNVADPAKRLVIEPFEFTFTRDLGVTE